MTTKISQAQSMLAKEYGKHLTRTIQARRKRETVSIAAKILASAHHSIASTIVAVAIHSQLAAVRRNPLGVGNVFTFADGSEILCADNRIEIV